MVDSYRESLQEALPGKAHASIILTSLSELISETTSLVARAKFLGPWQLDQFRGLSLSAMELYRRIQRSPRVQCNIPVLLFRDIGPLSEELTSTLDVSRRGACVSSTNLCAAGEKIWIQIPSNPQRSLTRVAWVKRAERAGFIMGLEILDHDDFWGFESLTAPKKIPGAGTGILKNSTKYTGGPTRA